MSWSGSTSTRGPTTWRTQAGASLVVDPRDPEWKRRILDFTGKHGVDATIICASSDSSEIINSSMEITRRQGRVVLVGYVKLDIHPKNFLYREIDLRYSARLRARAATTRATRRAALDYPFGYVRWTEKRNLEEFIRLIVHRRRLARAPDRRRVTTSTTRRTRSTPSASGRSSGRRRAHLATAPEPDRRPHDRALAPRPKQDGKVGISLIGFGNHVLGKHLPNLRAMQDVELRAIASATGRNALGRRQEARRHRDHHRRRRGCCAIPAPTAVLICSSQPEHYEHICKAIEADKAVFVEKPTGHAPRALPRAPQAGWRTAGR